MKFIRLTSILSDIDYFDNAKVIISELTLIVYIDDLLIAGEHEANIIYFKQLLKVWFKIKNLEKVYLFFDIYVRRYILPIILD